MGRDFRIEERPASYLVGCVGSGSFETAYEWTEQVWKQLLSTDPSYEGPFVTANHARQTEFTMYVGREYATPQNGLPEGLVSILLPAQSYATGNVRGDQSSVYACYQSLREWIGEQGKAENTAALGLEEYPKSPIPRTGDMEFDIWLPLLDQSMLLAE